ncbi:hypothetical protein CF129_13435 [Aeromonas dhakensis]|nr:hypothetical protein CF129_13435 [Aeromonas dhakensis]
MGRHFLGGFMLTSLLVLGVSHLLLTVLINIFERRELNMADLIDLGYEVQHSMNWRVCVKYSAARFTDSETA